MHIAPELSSMQVSLALLLCSEASPVRYWQ